MEKGWHWGGFVMKKAIINWCESVITLNWIFSLLKTSDHHYYHLYQHIIDNRPNQGYGGRSRALLKMRILFACQNSFPCTYHQPMSLVNTLFLGPSTYDCIIIGMGLMCSLCDAVVLQAHFSCSDAVWSWHHLKSIIICKSYNSSN